MVYSKETSDGYESILTRGGFTNLLVIKESVDCVSEDEEIWWEQMRHVGWHRYTKLIDELGAGELIKFKEAVFDALQAFKGADGVYFNKSVAFVFGSK